MRPRIVKIAGGLEGRHAALPLPGCGHMVVEAALRTFVPAGGKLLVVQNGAYADRLVRLATEAGRIVVAAVIHGSRLLQPFIQRIESTPQPGP